MSLHEKIVIPGRPVTKKNSSRIVVNGKTGRPFILPSQQFKEYQAEAGWHIRCKGRKIASKVNVKCVYYMPTRHKVDLANLIAATCDILVHYGVIEDDNSEIVVSHDGSSVRYDKENPRAEIEIEEV